MQPRWEMSWGTHVQPLTIQMITSSHSGMVGGISKNSLTILYLDVLFT